MDALQKIEPDFSSKLILLRGKGKPKVPKGLYLRGGVYWIRITDNQGNLIRESTHSDRLPAAIAFLNDRKAAYTSGRLVFEDPRDRERVLFKDFMIAAWDNPKAKYPRCTWKQAQVFFDGDKEGKRKLEAELGSTIFDRSADYVCRLKPLLAFFGDMEVDGIKGETLTAYCKARRNAQIAFVGKTKRSKISEACINRETTTFSDFWKRALKSREYKNRAASFPNPFDAEDHHGEEVDGRKVYWHSGIIDQFIKTARELAHTFAFPVELFVDICLFLINTGLRVESALLVKVGQIDLNNGLMGDIQFEAWQVKTPKNSKLPFRYEKAVEIARKYMMGKNADEFLFTWDDCHKFVNTGNGVEYGSFKHVYDLVFPKSGIRDGGIHSAFRKTYAMNRAIDGAGINKISRELFHNHLSTTELYIDWDLVEDEQTKREIALRNKKKGGKGAEKKHKISTVLESSDGQSEKNT